VTIEIRKKDDVCILDFSGNMTIGAGDRELRETFKDQLDEGARRFLFNLTKVRFMDSAGIGETVACSKRALERDGVIKIVVLPKGKPEEVLKIAWLDRVFELYHDEAAALASFKGDAQKRKTP
jgi:anti-sigma B factor antagonist